MKREYKYISYCGKYYCAFYDYYKGMIVKTARNLSANVERYGSLKLIADSNEVCNFDESMTDLKWLASQDKPCKAAVLEEVGLGGHTVQFVIVAFKKA